MQLPQLHGTFDQQDFFIYAACDHAYFAEFGPAFIGSIRANTDFNIHLHLFNPAPEQIEFCQRHGVGVTWEHVHQSLFVPAAQRWNPVPDQQPHRSYYERTVNAMGKGGDTSLLERMQKTYYACARFSRLSELICNQPVLAIDVDAVIRRPIPALDPKPDFFIHHISGKKARYLAGGLWLNPTTGCRGFMQEYSQLLRENFENDFVYWGLDQDLLDIVVTKYAHAHLPTEYIDWNMKDHSYIWTAKGTRKDLEIFVNEQRKYSV